ncbi:MAG: hypothetical protein KBD01_02255 [Acidobacteria bacterium]|nr:hypothetical protein [Acidobacteriota bacterium]
MAAPATTQPGLPRGFALRLLVVVGVSVAVTLALALGWSWRQDRRRAEEAQRARVQRTVELAHVLLQQHLDVSQSLLRGIAASRAIQEAVYEDNPREIHAALSAFRGERMPLFAIIDDQNGQPRAWTNRLALPALGPGPPLQAHRAALVSRLVAGDVSVVVDQPIERAGELIGRLRAAIEIGRLFTTRATTYLDAPIAVFLDGKVVHHSFPEIPPAPARPPGESGEVVFRTAPVGAERFEIAYRRVGGLEGDVWIAAGLTRAGIEVAGARYRTLIAAVGAAGLAIALAAVGAFLVLSQQQDKLARQRDAALRHSEGLSDRLAHLTAVVHDIKAPVAGIQLRSEALGESSADPAVRGALGQIADTCERLQLYLGNVLTAAQAEEGPIRPRDEVVLLAGLIEDVRDKVAPIADRRGVGLAVAAEPGLPAISADPAFLERALLNVAANALAATPDGGNVLLFARREGERIAVGVEDSGRGFGFDPAQAFSRERPRVRNASLRAGSSGLGLYIVARIVEAHGGQARAENLPGGGARVSLLLPASRVVTAGPAAAR